MNTMCLSSWSQRAIVTFLAAWFVGGSGRLAAIEPAWKTLEGHTDTVSCIAITPDSKMIASGSSDGTIRLWDVATGKEKNLLKVDFWAVTALAFVGDGSTLVSAGVNIDMNKRAAALQWWNLKTKRVIDTIPSTEGMNCIAYDPRGKIIATGSGKENDFSIVLREAMTRTEVLRLTGMDTYVHRLSFSATGKRLAASGFRGRLTVWDVEKKEIICQPLARHCINASAIRPDGMEVATASSELSNISLFNLETKTSITIDANWLRNRSSMLYHLDGKRLIVTADNELRVFEPSTGKRKRRFSIAIAANAAIENLAISNDGQLLVGAAGKDNTIKIWKLPLDEDKD